MQFPTNQCSKNVFSIKLPTQLYFTTNLLPAAVRKVAQYIEESLSHHAMADPSHLAFVYVLMIPMLILLTRAISAVQK